MTLTFQNVLMGNSINLSDTNVSKENIPCELSISKKKWMYDDFIFNAEGSTFYTYKNGFLHQWSLNNSIDHEKSIMIGIDFSKSQYKYKRGIDFMFLNNDESKMIFWTEDFFEIWDIKKEKSIGRKDVKSLFAIADTNENVFFTFDENNILKKWSIDNLVEKKSVKINFGCEKWDPESGTHAPSCSPIKLVVINNYIYVIAYNAIVKLDIKNMQELDRTFTSACASGNISSNKLFFCCSGTIYEASSLNKSKAKVNIYPASNWKRYFIYDKLYIRKVTVHNKSVFSLENLENRNRLGYFFHNNEGDWIIENRYFFDTNIPKEELKMSCKDNRKVLHMNKKVYQKTYKKINFKDFTYGNN